MKLFVPFYMSAAVLAAGATSSVGADDPVAPLNPSTVVLVQPEPLPVPPVGQVPQPVPLPPVDAVEGDNHLTLLDVENRALAYHPAMREAEGRWRAAQGKWLQVGLRPNPELGYSGMQIGDDGSAGQQGGFINQQFVTADKLGLNRAVASREVAAAEQRLEFARLQITTTTRTLYFEALAAERFVALARQLREIAGQSVQISEQRLKALDIPRVSLLQSQVEGETTALIEEQAIQRHEAAWRRLATAIGLPEQAVQAATLDDVLSRPLPIIDWKTTRDRLLAASPELAARRFEVDRARAAIERAAAGRVPNVDVGAGAAYDDATGDTIANVQVSMPFPIFDRNQGGLAEARGNLIASQAALEKMQLTLEQRLVDAIRDYNTSRERAVRYSEKVLPAARQSLDLTTNGYREGELDFTSVLVAQRTYAESNLAYLQNLELAWKKWAEIDGLLVGSLPVNAE